jgi:alpha-ketoglutarate-dependent 2,4-dichlorophenoxyacetate dioxygenase
MKELTNHATQRQFVYAHRWRAGDLVSCGTIAARFIAVPSSTTHSWPRDMQRVTTSDRIDAFGKTVRDVPADY